MPATLKKVMGECEYRVTYVSTYLRSYMYLDMVEGRREKKTCRNSPALFFLLKLARVISRDSISEIT